MKYVILAASLIVSFVAMILPALAEESGKYSVETGMDYNTGKYGGTQSTNILYVPVTGKYKDKLWTLRVTVPYLRITGPANVINGVGAVATANGSITTRSGLGDIILGATRSAYSNSATGVLVNLTGKIKLGTASSTQGLGTGANDYMFQSEIYQAANRLTRFAIIGYKIYGSATGYNLNNILYGSLGGSYKIDPATSGGMMLSLGQKATTTGSSRMEAIFFVSRKLDNTWKAQGYFLKGFTNSVPDIGFGATISYQL